jgi:beta-glucosidase/6-phospho-beta-glucosidase/beta-galactosidase
MGFPDGFLFGTANADHQVESHDPQREDVWDLWERCQGLTARGAATNFESRYEEDVASAAALGCRLFRFSIAWARVEPEEGKFDSDALAHYRAVAESIRGRGMKVMVTLHHFVWPVWLERDFGGMIGEEFPAFFQRYAKAVAEALGDQVDFWITFNEPSQLTFGYIKPWWQSRYYMPPGLPDGTDVEVEAEAVGKLVPNLFRAHAWARNSIRENFPDAKVGANPLVTGFPTWLQMLMDWAATHRGMAEALFKFTTSSALVSVEGEVDLVIGGVASEDTSGYEFSRPFLITGKAVLVRSDYADTGMQSLIGKKVGVLGFGQEPHAWKRDLPEGAIKVIFPDYKKARAALRERTVEALYGDALFLMPREMQTTGGFRFLAQGLSEEPYVVAAPHGHHALMDLVDEAVTEFQQEVMAFCDLPWVSAAGQVVKNAARPVSLLEVFGQGRTLSPLTRKRGLRRVKRRGRIRIGLRSDAFSGDESLEIQLAKKIALKVLGDESRLEIIRLAPSEKLRSLHSPRTWLNWAWRFWGTTSLIANVNWWYLGMRGRLSPELCPPEAIGAQDFVGLDYYWGLPTHKLHRFRSLEDAAHGRFIKAPVWPEGLYKALRRLHRWFPGQDLMIVENGCVPVANGVTRSDYLRLHLKQVERALKKGVPVKGFNYWSITSNREWGHPFDPNTDFGLYFVDLDRDPELKRVETETARVFREIIENATV